MNLFAGKIESETHLITATPCTYSCRNYCDMNAAITCIGTPIEYSNICVTLPVCS